MLFFLPRDVLDGIWDLIGSVSEGFTTYFLDLGDYLIILIFVFAYFTWC